MRPWDGRAINSDDALCAVLVFCVCVCNVYVCMCGMPFSVDSMDSITSAIGGDRNMSDL